MDRAIERCDQAGGEPLCERIGDRRQAIRNELCGAQHVAQIVIDAGDRHAKFSQALALRQFVGERPLHYRERRFGAADLVAPPARGDHA